MAYLEAILTWDISATIPKSNRHSDLTSSNLETMQKVTTMMTIITMLCRKILSATVINKKLISLVWWVTRWEADLQWPLLRNIQTEYNLVYLWMLHLFVMEVTLIRCQGIQDKFFSF